MSAIAIKPFFNAKEFQLHLDKIKTKKDYREVNAAINMLDTAAKVKSFLLDKTSSKSPFSFFIQELSDAISSGKANKVFYENATTQLTECRKRHLKD